MCQGGAENLGGGLQNSTGPLSRNIIINILESSVQAQLIGTLFGWFD